MRSVWSFWTKLWRERTGTSWPSEQHHLLAWILSFETARKHYPKTSLVTDDAGARMLVDGLGLGFDDVSTELNALADHDPAIWMLGKLRAYRAQTEPFIHLDTDVFLWKRLSENLERSPVFAQNPEPFISGASHYKPDKIQEALRQRTQGWIPQEWEWSLSFGNPQQAECCGVFGGTCLDFIHYYVDLAFRLIEAPENRAGWGLLGLKGNYLVELEQYHLGACVAYHRNRPGSCFRNIEIQYLFDSFDMAFNANVAAKVGFTHLLSSAKQNRVLAERLERRVKRDYPKQYERCIHYSNQRTTK